MAYSVVGVRGNRRSVVVVTVDSEREARRVAGKVARTARRMNRSGSADLRSIAFREVHIWNDRGSLLLKALKFGKAVCR